MMHDLYNRLMMALYYDLDMEMAKAFEAHEKLVRTIAEYQRRDLTREYRQRIIESGGRLDA